MRYHVAVAFGTFHTPWHINTLFYVGQTHSGVIFARGERALFSTTVRPDDCVGMGGVVFFRSAAAYQQNCFRHLQPTYSRGHKVFPGVFRAVWR
jgi:hypothetical protein